MRISFIPKQLSTIILTFCFVSLAFVGMQGCGGGSGSANRTGPQNPAQDNPEQHALVGSWLQTEPDPDGFRLQFDFSNSTTQGAATTQLNAVVRFIEVDGSDVGNIAGTAEFNETEMTLTFPELLGEKFTFPYDLADSTLNIDGIAYSKITGNASSLPGNASLSGTLTVAGISASSSQVQFIPGEVLVVYRQGPGSLSKSSSRLGKGFSSLSTNNTPMQPQRILAPGKSTFKIRGAKPTSFAAKLAKVLELRRWTLKKIQELKQDTSVLHVQPNYIYKAYKTPTDEAYPNQWHYPLIQLPAAWDISEGDASVITAVIDTGVRLDHPDLAPRLRNDGFDFVSDANHALDGDGIDADPMDPGDAGPNTPSSFHGTHVAGTIGADSNPANPTNSGVAGVTWHGQNILPIRVLGAGGTGSSYDISQGILYAAGLSNASNQVPSTPAHIINLSLGSPNTDFIMDSAIASALQNGVIVVAAAGNENQVSTGSPAATPGVINVGAVGPDGHRAPYSNFGGEIDVVAPGGNNTMDQNGDGIGDGVLSTSFTDGGQAIYQAMNGTSMAAPHIAGIVSLMLSVEPSLSSAQVLQILKNTATPLGDLEFEGAGLVNAGAAVNAAANNGNNTQPDSLVVEPNLVQFNANALLRTVLIQNAGEGSIDNLDPFISAIDPDDIGDTNWLNGGISSTSTPSQLVLEVTPTNLDANTTYNATIQINSNAGSALVNVRVLLSAGGSVPAGEIFVLAVDQSSGLSMAQVTADPNTLQYRFPALEADVYHIVAGTSSDGGLSICGAQDLCGAFLSLSDPVSIPIIPGNNVTDIDFSLSVSSTTNSLEEGGYELLN